MDHDPFCKAYYPDLLEPERCMWCMVIRRVREDERNTIDLDVEYWVGYNKGYLDGYTNAETEFTNPCCFCGHDDFSTYVCDDCKEEEFWNEDMSENADNIEMSANDDKNGGTQ